MGNIIIKHVNAVFGFFFFSSGMPLIGKQKLLSCATAPGCRLCDPPPPTTRLNISPLCSQRGWSCFLTTKCSPKKKPNKKNPPLSARLPLFTGIFEVGFRWRSGGCVCGGVELPAGSRAEGRSTGWWSLSLSVSPSFGVAVLNVGGEVKRVALELGEGDGRMLQVVEQHLDLSHDVM